MRRFLSLITLIVPLTIYADNTQNSQLAQQQSANNQTSAPAATQHLTTTVMGSCKLLDQATLLCIPNNKRLCANGWTQTGTNTYACPIG